MATKTKQRDPEANAPEGGVPEDLKNLLRRQVLTELAKRARRLDDEGCCELSGDIRSLAQFLDYLADTFSFADDFNLPGARDPLILAELVYCGGSSKGYVLAIQRGGEAAGQRLVPVWAKLASDFQPL